MKTMRRAIIAILLIVLVCATFVACNDGNGNNIGNNGDNGDERGYQLATEIKPFAQPDPNNQYDFTNKATDYSGLDFEVEKISISFTNTESLNNLFYDFKISDFDTNKFTGVSETYPDRLKTIRDKVFVENYDSSVKSYSRTLWIYLKEPSRENVLQYINEFRQKEWIKFADADIKTGGAGWFATTNDPRIGERSAAFSKIQMFDAWQRETGSASINVGVIDTGIDKTHEDLAGNMNLSLGLGSDYSDDPYDVGTTQMHGTAVAGIIGAVGNNGIGTSGVCQRVSLVSLRADGDEFSVRDNNYLEDPDCFTNAVIYATNHNIPILNFSGGFYSDRIRDSQQSEMENAINNYNGLLVVAAGNENYNLSTVNLYPQTFDCDNMLVVGATTDNDAIWYERALRGSNYSATMVDLFAPGVYIDTTWPGNIYTREASIPSTGTSMAAPFVTGVAALIKSAKPSISTSALKTAIMKSVDKIDALNGKCVSGGRLNADAALLYATHTHNKATTDYVNLGVTKGHTAKCRVCDYDVTEGHTWITVGPTLAPKGYQCSGCGVFTKTIEIVIFDNVVELEGAFEKEAVLVNGVEMMAVSDDVAIIKGEGGRYYILVACDENGEIANDIVEDIKIPWLKDLIANEVSKVKDEKD